MVLRFKIRRRFSHVRDADDLDVAVIAEYKFADRVYLLPTAFPIVDQFFKIWVSLNGLCKPGQLFFSKVFVQPSAALQNLLRIRVSGTTF
jgi:hypothetical protein